MSIYMKADGIQGDGFPAEALRLNYTKLQITTIPRDKTNTQQSPSTVGYNQETAEAL